MLHFILTEDPAVSRTLTAPHGPGRDDSSDVKPSLISASFAAFRHQRREASARDGGDVLSCKKADKKRQARAIGCTPNMIYLIMSRGPENSVSSYIPRPIHMAGKTHLCQVLSVMCIRAEVSYCNSPSLRRSLGEHNE